MSRKGLERRLRSLDSALSARQARPGTVEIARRSPDGRSRTVLSVPEPQGSGDEVVTRLQKMDTWNRNILAACEASEQQYQERVQKERIDLHRAVTRDIDRIVRGRVGVTVPVTIQDGRVIY